MNVERLKQVRDAIEAAPPEEFDYSQFFRVIETKRPLQGAVVVPAPHCGTAGCVAGWTMMLFEPGSDVQTAYHTSGPGCAEFVAAQLLELTPKESDFLFILNAIRATRADALRRLDWMLAGLDIDEYDWDQEPTFSGLQ